MNIKSEKEAQWLRTEILPKIQLTDQSVKNLPTAAGTDSVCVRDIRIDFIGTEESFMLTTCYRAIVTLEANSVVHTRHLVVKKTPELPPEVFDAINFRALFGNEMLAYTSILPALMKFASQSIAIPKYYYGDVQPNFATIILEDFNVNGWHLSKEKANLPLEHVLLAMKYLAQFHGIGFAMKQVNPESFNAITSQLMEARFANPFVHDEYQITQTQGIKRLEKVTRIRQPSVSEEFLQRILHLLDDHFSYGRQMVQPVEPMATLCHGDYLRNNVAFKYAPQSNIPEDVIMFDLQTMRVSSPMLDVAVFLALSTFAEVRSVNFMHIFSVYCSELAKTYEAHTGASAPAFLSQDSLLKEYVRFLPYSVSIAAFFLSSLVEPDQMSAEEMLLQKSTTEQLVVKVMTRGGETVDREISHQVRELYDLSVLHGVDVFEGFNLPA